MSVCEVTRKAVTASACNVCCCSHTFSEWTQSLLELHAVTPGVLSFCAGDQPARCARSLSAFLLSLSHTGNMVTDM